MNKYRDLLFSYENKKENTFLYELALSRGKNRGWYPKNWNLNDYICHLFSKKV